MWCIPEPMEYMLNWQYLKNIKWKFVNSTQNLIGKGKLL